MWYESISYTQPYLSARHHHLAWQLTASIRGTFQFRTKRKTVSIAPGEWVLLPPGMMHSAGSDSPESRAMQLFFRRFPPNLLPELAAIFNLRRDVCFHGRTLVEVWERLAADYLAHGGDGMPYCRSWRGALALDFVMAALPTMDEACAPRPAPAPPGLVRALEYMEKHFAEPVGIAEFAAAAGYSESHFSALFRAEIGDTPMHFFNAIRLGNAQELLLLQHSVAETAVLCGFSGAQYFCRRFRAALGVSPGEFCKAPFGRSYQS